MNKQHFTLIELLMAIAIIVILAAIAIPVTASAIKKAEIAKAQAEMTTLVNALKNYETTYGLLPVKPFTKQNSGDYVVIDGEDDYEKLIKILQADSSTVTDTGLNKRKIAFLEVQGNTDGEFTDPWGKNYVILMDANGDGKMDVMDSQTENKNVNGLSVVDKDGNKTSLRKDIVIWSLGPDGLSDKKLDADENADNVYSIPVLWDKGNGTWTPDTH